MIGMTPEETRAWARYHLNIPGAASKEQVEYAPWRQTRFDTHQEIALLGEEVNARQFASDFGLLGVKGLGRFEKLSDPESAGFAEIITPPPFEPGGPDTANVRAPEAIRSRTCGPVSPRGEHSRRFFRPPIAAGDAQIGAMDPRPLVLLAAVCAANSFILPTHQVNAMLKAPGGYRNADYLKAGGGMTLIFLAVVTPMFYFFYF